jgi:hypothetical protein
MTAAFNSFTDFTAAVQILSAAQADVTRDQFITARVDPELVRKIPGALEIKQFSDGPAYDGYLWDFLAGKRVVSEEAVWDAVAGLEQVYAMWDLHSAERVRIPGYFRFPRGTIIRTDPETLSRGLEYLPEDLYVFDESCGWAVVVTHEYIDGTRFCLCSGRIEAVAGG